MLEKHNQRLKLVNTKMENQMIKLNSYKEIYAERITELELEN